MNGYYKQVTDELTKAGYKYLRPGKGSHEMWSNGSRTTTVPRNLMSRHTANDIMKQAGIARKF